MKTGFKKNVKWLFATLLLTFCMNVFSQKPIIWKGGTPGQKNDWYCAQNWSTHTVPDEFSDVIIPDVSTSSFAFPVIRSGRVEVNSLFIQFNGSLIIGSAAVLTVLDNAEGCNEGKIHGEGLIILHNMNMEKEMKRIAGNLD